MSQRKRALALLGALAVLVVAFVALRPGDEDDPATTTTTTATATAEPAATAATTTPAERPESEPAAKPEPKPRPPVATVRVTGLKPVGGVRSITVHKDETVRFDVTSDRPESVHLHGYDVEKPVAPGKPARYRFKADIEGIFEVELEHSGVPLIKLTVEP